VLKLIEIKFFKLQSVEEMLLIIIIQIAGGKELKIQIFVLKELLKEISLFEVKSRGKLLQEYDLMQIGVLRMILLFVFETKIHFVLLKT
jgi:hypothetical protein